MDKSFDTKIKMKIPVFTLFSQYFL